MQQLEGFLARLKAFFFSLFSFACALIQKLTGGGERDKLAQAKKNDDIRKEESNEQRLEKGKAEKVDSEGKAESEDDRDKQEREERERIAREEAEKKEQERLAKEREERERLAREEVERQQKEQERLAKEKEEKERREREEQERLKKEKEEQERKEREEQERLAKEKEERERKEREERERKEKEERERKEREERERKEKEERERKEKEEQERLAKEKEEKERKEREERERKEKEEQERLKKEREEQERLAKEKAEQEKREKEEQEEQERLAREKEERERKEREEQERLKKEKEEQERKEKEEQERLAREKEEQERKEREEQERLKKEKEEQERKEKEERERKEREEQERLKKEKEKQDAEAPKSDPATREFPPGMEAKRKQAIAELVESEVNYCEFLQSMMDYQTHLAKVIPPDQSKLIFANISPLVLLSQTFVKSFAVEQRKGTVQAEISTCFSNAKQFVKLMVPYIELYPKVSEVVTELSNGNKEFNKVCAKLEETHQPLSSLIVMPVQRIAKYPLLIKEILKATPEWHPDYAKLPLAMEEMKEASHNADIKVQDAARRDQIMDIQRSIKKCPNLIAANRTLVGIWPIEGSQEIIVMSDLALWVSVKKSKKSIVKTIDLNSISAVTEAPFGIFLAEKSTGQGITIKVEAKKDELVRALETEVRKLADLRQRLGK